MWRTAFGWIACLMLALAFIPTARAASLEDHAGAQHETSAASHAGEAGHGVSTEHAQPNILEFKPSLALSTLIVFLLLLFVLGKFAWGPLAKALDERERFHEEALQKSELARAESERLLAEHRQLMARANDEVRTLIDQARKSAEAAAGEIVAKAQSEAEAAKQRAERDIAQARDQALNEIWSRTADLAVNVAGKVLSREVNADEHRRLVNSAMDALSSMATTSNGHGGPA